LGPLLAIAATGQNIAIPFMIKIGWESWISALGAVSARAIAGKECGVLLSAEVPPSLSDARLSDYLG